MMTMESCMDVIRVLGESCDFGGSSFEPPSKTRQQR
jgi:hypothetical protein